MKKLRQQRRTAEQEKSAPLINGGSHCELIHRTLRPGISERELPGTIFYAVNVWIKYTLRGSVKDMPCCINQMFERETKTYRTIADLIRQYSELFTINSIQENVILPEIEEKDIRLGGDTITVQHLRYRVAEVFKCYEDETGDVEVLAMALPLEGAYWNWLMSTPEEIADLDVDSCLTTDELDPTFAKLTSQKPELKADVA